MLADLRFLFGASLAAALLGVLALGLVTTVRLSHQGKISPIEASRSFAYAERERTEAVDPELMRAFAALGRTAAKRDGPPQTAAMPAPATVLPEPASTVPAIDPGPAAASLPQPTTGETAVDVSSEPPPREADLSAEPISVEEATVAPQPPASPSNSIIGPSTEPPDTSAAVAAVSPMKEATDPAVVEVAPPDPTPTATIARPAGIAPEADIQATEALPAETAAQPSRPAVNATNSATSTVDAKPAATTAAHEPIEAPAVVAPHAARATRLHHPVTKVRRASHGRAVKAKAPKTKLVRAKPKAAMRARTTVRRPTAWTGYPVARQARTSWGWGF